MKQQIDRPTRFGVCVENTGYRASLERNKIYVMLQDADAGTDGNVRVIDESGDDYLFPASWFVVIEVPPAVQASVLNA